MGKKIYKFVDYNEKDNVIPLNDVLKLKRHSSAKILISYKELNLGTGIYGGNKKESRKIQYENAKKSC